MDHIEEAAFLKGLVRETNKKLLDINKNGLVNKNLMVVHTIFGQTLDIKMDAFTNEFVLKTLQENDSDTFVITDLVTIVNEGKELTYFLYKAYSTLFDKGVVYFQPINKKTFEPKGDLKFSNLEDNIFYKVEYPDIEESSCNAIETKETTVKNPSVAFLIGHMNEERLLLDIKRLIFDTANNVQKHKNRQFHFIIQISKFGGKPSEEFLYRLDDIKKMTEKHIAPEYPNSTFKFELD